MADGNRSIFVALEQKPHGQDEKEKAQYLENFVVLRAWLGTNLRSAGMGPCKPTCLLTSAQSYYVVGFVDTKQRDQALRVLGSVLTTRIFPGMEPPGKRYAGTIDHPVELCPFSVKPNITVWHVNSLNPNITLRDVSSALKESFQETETDLPAIKVKQALQDGFPNGNLLIRFSGVVPWTKKTRLHLKGSSQLLVTQEGPKKCLFCQTPGHSAWTCQGQGGGLAAGEELGSPDEEMQEASASMELPVRRAKSRRTHSTPN